MVLDYIIVGAGPAGLQLGSLLAKTGVSYQILESGSGVGSFFKTYPRHRKLISINKKYTGDSNPERNLRVDWNSLLADDPELLFTRFSDKYFPSADTYVEYLENFSAKQSLNISFNTRVSKIDRNAYFQVSTDKGDMLTARCVVIATGVSKENIPDIPGIELCEKYSETDVNPTNFVNQRVLVLGKGNSAFETADNLIETTAFVHVAGRSSIKLAWQTHYVGHLRAVNNNLLDTYQLKSQNAILDGNVLNIEKVGDEYVVDFSFSRSNEVQKRLVYDRVIVCTGFRFDADIFAEACRPQLAINDRFPEMTSAWESVNVPDLFFAGTIMQQRDFKKSTSGFVHGFRYAVRSLFNLLVNRYQNIDLPASGLALSSEGIAEKIVARVNETSALWQLFEFMCDCIVVSDKQGLFIEELPVDYCHEFFGNNQSDYFNITLEYGPDHDKVDPFNIEVERVKQNDHENAFNAQYLHPVVRFYRRGMFVSEHHMAENLENKWDGRESHLLPLQRFIHTCLVLNELKDDTKETEPSGQAMSV
ncbi:pyridine nucleotide-disulfide oxidoreductase [Alteromonadaceae bacterium 2753L.S.0a.02]|nr:pyridine nucleotide-disulfide oxidoreductase [Alteromonadaceae bacterium 2753L.S.0a.02]